MDINIYTWGTGGAFGRELGIIPKGRKRREHSSVSIIGTDKGSTIFHFMVDAGAPCAEKMIDKGIGVHPEVLFMTHAHNDHISDFDKLVNSRKRGLMYSKDRSLPFNIICTQPCSDELKAKFKYLENSVNYIIPNDTDVWYSIDTGNARILPSDQLKGSDSYPVEFKVLPVYHAVHAPGACMYIFRIKDNKKRIVASGDFESITDDYIGNADLIDPDALIIETNTIRATGTGHTNWQQNMKLLDRWLSGSSKTKVLLTHLSGYEDWEQKFYDHIPTDRDWSKAVGQYKAHGKASIKIAEDSKRYMI